MGTLSRAGAAVAAALATIATGLCAVAPAARAAQTPASTPALQLEWTVHVPDGGTKIALSSPNEDTFASGGPAVVVGDRAGRVYAYHLAGGSSVGGFPVSVGAPVTSTPSVIQAGPLAGTIAVGTGNAADPCTGGYTFIRPTLAVSQYLESNPATDRTCAHNGVEASIAVGTLQRRQGAVAGSLGEVEDALTTSSPSTLGAALTGFPWFQADTNFSTPAIADLYGTGGTEIVEGGASTAGLALGGTYTSGGHIRVLSGSGNYNTGAPGGGLQCEITTTQQVTSSPAVGPFLATGAEGIALGTGSYWPYAAGVGATDQLLATRTNCSVAWDDTLDGITASSPALADVMGDGQLQVVEATQTGTIYALDGATGAVLWSHEIPQSVIYGSVTAADLGAGHADVLVTAANGLYILTGTNGTELGSVTQPYTAFQNAALVTDDPDGAIGITVAGYRTTGSYIFHYQVTGSTGMGAAAVTPSTTWPQFHHTAGLDGTIDAAPDGRTTCSPAAPGTANGYLEAAADGGIFDFSQNMPFCGSTGSIALTAPVVSITATPGGTGYWEVTADGGVYAFGDAQFYGSMGGRPLNEPIVGMAAAPTGYGYWLVASDGGIFAFNTARHPDAASFFGSMGGKPLNKPIVGMAAARTGQGYYLVASDGGIFAFNKTPAHPAAAFHGSTGDLTLNEPVVGMSLDPASGGYWLVASDGGIFAFPTTTPFYGSRGGQPLDAPIVGMSAADTGKGYYLVASDGGIFAYNLRYYGSMGGRSLNKPVIGMAAFATFATG